MVKKLGLFILISALFLVPVKAFAAEREMTITVATSTGIVVPGEVALYGYDFIATGTAGSIGIYDNLTNSQTEADIKAEHQEATQYNSPPHQRFEEPILFDDGLYAEINSADVILHYKK